MLPVAIGGLKESAKTLVLPQSEVELTRTEPVGNREGVHLSDLDVGCILELKTKHHRYEIRYLGEDQASISGNAELSPLPITARIKGSLNEVGGFEPRFIGRGMRMVFRRADTRESITTSKIAAIERRKAEPR
jgi:hypothetical protein